MPDALPSGPGMDDLLAALAELQFLPAEIVSDTFADHGLVRLLVRSDSTITVEIDPYAAEDVEVGEVERHVLALVRAASVPVPEPAPAEPEPPAPPPPTNAEIIASIRDKKR